MSVAGGAQLPLGVQLRPACRLDNFVASDDAASTRALEGMLAATGELRLYLHGPQASGKSHLLEAACHALSAAGSRVAYVPLRERVRFAPALLAGFGSLDLTCLDDVDAIAEQPAWERAVFNLYNEMEARGGRLLVASRRLPAVFGLPDLASRLDAMLRIRLEPPDDERRARILGQRSAELGISLPVEVVRYLLAHQPRDLHSLMATLHGIDRFALGAKRKVSLPLVLDYLRDDRS